MMLNNLHKRRVAAGGGSTPPPPPEYNTFIGGAASSVPDPATLASKLSITEADITAFNINGSDVEAKIDKIYNINDNAFLSDTSITSYLDTGGMLQRVNNYSFKNSTLQHFQSSSCNYVGVECFRGSQLNNFDAINTATIQNGSFMQTKLVDLDLRNVTTVNGSGSQIRGNSLLQTVNLSKAPGLPNLFLENNSALIQVDLRVCTTIGLTTGHDGTFNSLPASCELILPSSLATANGGAEEGDVAYARNTRGCTITYV